MQLLYNVPEVYEMKNREEKFAINPMTGEKIYKTVEVFVYGVTEDEFLIIADSLPNNKVHITDCSDCFTDILVLPYIAVIINPDILTQENIEDLKAFYGEVGTYSEKIVFTKKNPILDSLNNVKYIVFESKLEYEDKLKYVLLDAVKLDKKYKSYSETISQMIRVLSEIRKHPGITSVQLAEMIERNPRTVQRYIATLNCAGEFIEYDSRKKGWFLFENKSLLFGDY